MALICQLLSALSSAASEHLAAVGSCHALHKAMLLFTVQLFRLICSFHCVNLLTRCKCACVKHCFKAGTHPIKINYNPNCIYMSTKSFKTGQRPRCEHFEICFGAPQPQSPFFKKALFGKLCKLGLVKGLFGVLRRVDFVTAHTRSRGNQLTYDNIFL